MKSVKTPLKKAPSSYPSSLKLHPARTYKMPALKKVTKRTSFMVAAADLEVLFSFARGTNLIKHVLRMKPERTTRKEVRLVITPKVPSELVSSK